MNLRVTAVLFVILLALGGIVLLQVRQEEAEPTSVPEDLPPTPERVLLVTDANMLDVQRVVIRQPSTGLEASFSHDGLGGWMQTVPTPTLVLSQTMNTKLGALVTLTSRRTLAAGENPLSAYGLELPAYEIEMAVGREDGRVVQYGFAIGNETPAGDGYYLRRAADQRVHIVSKFPIDSAIGLLTEPPVVLPAADQ